MERKENRRSALLTVAIIAALVLGYLFALNGRYALVRDSAVVLDKWSRTYYKPGDNSKLVPLTSPNN